MKILGLTGLARSGKDTVAGYLQAGLVDLDVQRQGFADALKLSAARIWNPDATLAEALEFCNAIKAHGYVTVIDDEANTATEITGREFLQNYGTEAHRAVFGEDFWLDAVLPEGRDDCDLLVIPDARFANEAQRIKDRGGRIWKVVRKDQPGLGGTLDQHPSETGVPNELVDRVIHNDGTLTDLQSIVSAAWAADRFREVWAE